MEGASFGGGSVIWWRERHLMGERHLVEGASFGGGSVMACG